ncbi:hypothetical protein Dimus_038231 [Dionaea muscipula]
MVFTRRTAEGSATSAVGATSAADRERRLPPPPPRVPEVQIGGVDSAHRLADGEAMVGMTPDEYVQFKEFQQWTPEDLAQFRRFMTMEKAPAEEVPPPLRATERHAERVAAPPRERLEVELIDLKGRTFDRFMGLKPPRFVGSTNALEASNWLREIERILETIGCVLEHRVSLASFMLKEAAEFWWDGIQRRYHDRGEVIDWTTFMMEFENKYFTSHIQNQKKAELLALRQGSMTIPEYDAKFAELERFAPELVTTEPQRMFLFLNGMDPDLQATIRT